MATVRELVEYGRQRLAGASFHPPLREASLLLAKLLGINEATIIARDDDGVSDPVIATYRTWIERRRDGEPVAYILGSREFFGRPFRVDRRVLIPRPETELIVECALELDLPKRPTILDLGTGSGCLAVTLAMELNAAHVLAVDRSLSALAVASLNSTLHGCSAVQPLAADYSSATHLAAFDLIVSNPPYIEPNEKAGLSMEITEFEPEDALVARAGAEVEYQRLLKDCADLRPGTPVVLEIGYQHGELLTALAGRYDFAACDVVCDLAGLPRVARLRR